MSRYIDEMTKEEAYEFKAAKRRFKKGKPCARCGRKLAPKRMTVDHINRVHNGAHPYDEGNWQVLCLPCHQGKSERESRE